MREKNEGERKREEEKEMKMVRETRSQHVILEQVKVGRKFNE